MTTDSTMQSHDESSLETDQPASPGGPVPFEAAVSDLPGDPESIEFAQALQALKPLFSSRTEFNFMVCDQLALRGLSPNGLNVRKAGSWGAPVAVGADVKAWYTALSARLSSEHAKIPEASKRAANSLLEQLWTLAREGVGAPLAEKLDRTQQELASERESHAAAMATTLHEHSNETHALRQDVEKASEAVESMHMDLSQARAELADLHRSKDGLIAEVAALRASIAEAALTHEREKREMAQSHQAALQELRSEAKAAALAQAQNEAALRDQLQAERARLDEASRSHALAVDSFRQDLRQAVQRGDQALAAIAQEKSVATDLREQLATSMVEQSRLERKIADNLTALGESQRRVDELERDLITAKNSIEGRQRPIDTSGAPG